MKALITTTINVPHVLSKWATGLDTDDWIIVAGDQKTPHNQVDGLLMQIHDKHGVNVRYLHPDDQHVWSVSETLGWNCIQRRNIALLEAISLNPEYIITVDDDNHPTTLDQINKFINEMNTNTEGEVVTSKTGWWDPGSTCAPVVSHRGFPLSMRHAEHEYEYNARSITEHIVAVGAMLWIGDPDVDAVTRMCCDPLVTDVEFDTFVPPGIWAPFNSQATVYRIDVAPLMLMWPGVGRYDDIWASYLARRVMDHFGLSVYYGSPLVRQERNEHNLMVDLTNELFGMTFTDEIISELRDVEVTGSVITVAMAQVMARLSTLEFLPTQTKESFGAWQDDINRIR